ncbi:anti-sigma factor [Roseivivax sp.]
MSDQGDTTDGPTGPDPEEDAARAAEYVLGLLPEDELPGFEARLAREPELVEVVVSWTEHFAAMAEALPPVAPAPQLKRRIEALAFGTPAARPWWRSLLPYALGAVAAAVFGWAVLTTGMLTPEAPEPTYVADLAAEAGPELLVHAGYLAESNEFLIRRDGGAVPEGADHEMWIIGGDGTPISLGLVPREPGVIARQVLPEELRPLLEGGTLAVSLEPAGGSPDGTPTEVRAVGPIRPYTET